MARPPSISALPPGRYAVAVSGGADSTALLRLAVEHGVAGAVVHLNHELRGDASDGDETFVRGLASALSLPIVCERLSTIRQPDPPRNDSARYRAARLALFRNAVDEHRLAGVLLAHHSDDQAEGVLLRLLRGASVTGLRGMSPHSRIAGLDLYRPLLNVPRAELRAYLHERGQPWREDASNDSPAYRRNVVRQLLAGQPELAAAFLSMADNARRLNEKLNAFAQPAETLPVSALRQPAVIAEHVAGQWLIARGAPPDAVSPATRQRLVTQATRRDAAARQNYPGGLLVRRFQKFLHIIPAPPIRPARLQSTESHGQDQTAPTSEL